MKVDHYDPQRLSLYIFDYVYTNDENENCSDECLFLKWINNIIVLTASNDGTRKINVEQPRKTLKEEIEIMANSLRKFHSYSKYLMTRLFRFKVHMLAE